MTEHEDFDMKRTQLRQLVYGLLTVGALFIIIVTNIILFERAAQARDQVVPALRCAVTAPPATKGVSVQPLPPEKPHDAGMTHERLASGEHPHGPEHDHSLPDADSIPGDLSPEDSDASPLTGDL